MYRCKLCPEFYTLYRQHALNHYMKHKRNGEK